MSRFGHVASDCPNRKVITLVECQEFEEAELKEEGSDKEVHLIEIEEECVVEADVMETIMNGPKTIKPNPRKTQSSFKKSKKWQNSVEKFYSFRKN